MGHPGRPRRAQDPSTRRPPSRTRWRSRCGPTGTSAPSSSPPRVMRDGVHHHRRRPEAGRGAHRRRSAKQASILAAEGERQSADPARRRVSGPPGSCRRRGRRRRSRRSSPRSRTGKPTPELLAYQYLQTLPQLAQGDSNKVWMIPSGLLDKALEQFRHGCSATKGEDGVFRYEATGVRFTVGHPGAGRHGRRRQGLVRVATLSRDLSRSGQGAGRTRAAEQAAEISIEDQRTRCAPPRDGPTPIAAPAASATGPDRPASDPAGGSDRPHPSRRQGPPNRWVHRTGPDRWVRAAAAAAGLPAVPGNGGSPEPVGQNPGQPGQPRSTGSSSRPTTSR